MNLQNVVITQKQDNPADYNIKADIYDNEGNKIGDFGAEGQDVFTWWIQQDEMFRFDIVNQFKWSMAKEIVNGTAE